MGKGDLAALLQKHVPSLQDEGYMRSNIEIIEHYEGLLVAFAAKTSRLRVGDLEEAARQLYPEAGSCSHKTFAQRLSAAMSMAVTKARHCSAGASLHPPSLQRLVRALMQGSPTSSTSASSGACGAALATPEEVAALWGVKPAARAKHIQAGLIEIYSSQEIEEAESAGGEDSFIGEAEMAEEGGAPGSSEVPAPGGGAREAAGPAQGLKEVEYPDLVRKVMVLMSAIGTKKECKLLKGPQGYAVYDKGEGSICDTEIPNLMLDPPVIKRPAAAPKPAAGRKKARKEQDIQKELGGGEEAPEGPEGEAEGEEREGELEADEGEEEELAEADGGEEAEDLQNQEEPEGEAEAEAAPEGPAPEPKAARAQGPVPRKYMVMWYRPPRGALALRQAYGAKRQIFQVVADSVGSTKEQLEALYARLIPELESGNVQEAGAKAWVVRELAEGKRRAA
jgi:hypothetical protein